MPATFNEAFEEARSQIGIERWLSLTPSEQTTAIYRAMRRLDSAARALLGRLSKSAVNPGT